jgi:hypothetical protein
MIKIITAAIVLLSASGRDAVAQEGRLRPSEQHHQHVRAEDKGTGQEKWKLDANTRSNVAGIKKLIQGQAAEKDLSQLAKALQKQTDQLIAECRLEGADHDALHVWLTEYLQHLRHLKDPASDRRKAYRLLQDDIKKLEAEFQ